MFDAWGYGTYIFYACFCAMAAIWAFLFVPETMNKTLEQIDDAFGDDSGLEEQELMHEVLGQIFVHP
ncbi:hypothetical protein D0863_08763 [Hortaea werneckii]|nr:hypothetical protein D0863_08763 [Hortaea werneckii]